MTVNAVRVRYYPVAFVLVLISHFSGCGRGDRPQLAKASGIVTLDGEPVEGATVNFQPETGGRIATGMTDETGRYQITTFQEKNDGAAVGDHFVAVIKLGGDGIHQIAEAAPELDGLAPDINAPGSAPIEFDYLVPEKYMNAKTSGLKATVPKKGSEDLNFELTSE